MKNITRITIFFTFLTSTFLFLNFYKYYDEIGIPGYEEGFIITNLDKKLSKKEANKVIVKLSNKYNTNIIRENKNYEDNGKSKFLVQYKNDKHSFSERPFTYGKKYKLLEPNDVKVNQLKLVGAFFFTDEPLPQTFYKELEDNGLTAVYFNQPVFFVLVDYLNVYKLIPSIGMLMIILFIAILYHNVTSIKDMSIKRLHGFTTQKIFRIKSKELFIIFLKYFFVINMIMTIGLLIYNKLAQFIYVQLSFLVFALMFLTILFIMMSISFIIVYKESFKITKYIKYDGIGNILKYLPGAIKILVMLTLLNVINSSMFNYNELKDNLVSEKYWIKNKDLFMTEISTNENGTDKEKNDNVEKRILTLINKIPEDKWLLSYNNYYDWKNKGERYDLENAIFVNKTYVKRNGIKVKGEKQIDFSRLTILLPEKAYNKKNIFQLKKEMNEYINQLNDERSITNKEKYLNVEVVKTDNHFELFNYSSMFELKNAISYNPVIVIMPKELNPFAFYSTAASNGSLLFIDYNFIQNKIEKYKLDDEIQGLTNIYSKVLDDIQQLKLNLGISLITAIFGSVVLFSVYIFNVCLYCDSEKKKIFVKTIHGYSFVKKHYQFMMISIVSSLISLLIVKYFDVLSFSFPVICSVILFEILSLIFVIRRYEYYLLKNARRGESQ